MLTKSDLAAYRQCPRRLWLEHHQPELAISGDLRAAQRRRDDGNLVGEMARKLLGPELVWPKGQETLEASAKNALAVLAAAPNAPAVEVPLYRDGLYARADVMLPTRSGYLLREVKASSFPLKKDKLTPSAPEDHHVEDLAIQAWVYAGTGLPFAGAELLLLNGQWRYPGNGDYTGLFRSLDVTDAVAALQGQVPEWLRAAGQALETAMPAVRTGRQCGEPVDCPFLGYCESLEPQGPEHPIDLLPGTAGKRLAKRLRADRGYTSLLDPSPDELEGKEATLYLRIQRAHRSGTAVLEGTSAAELAKLPYPRYYFDFEGIDLPVPIWPGVRPYEQIPFQWSCHIERSRGHFEHAEFLDLSGGDPSRSCMEQMLEVMPPDEAGPIFVYYQPYEQSRLAELAVRHPEFRKPVDAYIARLVDLRPITRDNYYHPAMQGSFSIKDVLPTIAPELDYAALEEVRGGVGAQLAYLEAALDPATTAARKAAIRSHLLVYCEQDSWAMVELAHFLERRGRPSRP